MENNKKNPKGFGVSLFVVVIVVVILISKCNMELESQKIYATMTAEYSPTEAAIADVENQEAERDALSKPSPVIPTSTPSIEFENSTAVGDMVGEISQTFPGDNYVSNSEGLDFLKSLVFSIEPPIEFSGVFPIHANKLNGYYVYFGYGYVIMSEKSEGLSPGFIGFFETCLSDVEEDCDYVLEDAWDKEPHTIYVYREETNDLWVFFNMPSDPVTSPYPKR